MEKDPFELYPLHNNHIIVQDILIKVREIAAQHLNSIVDVPEQLGNFSRNLIPCCNPPHCSCDLLNHDFHSLIARRAKNREKNKANIWLTKSESPNVNFLISNLENEVKKIFF